MISHYLVFTPTPRKLNQNNSMNICVTSRMISLHLPPAGHRRRIESENKPKVVASDLGDRILATLAVLPRSFSVFRVHIHRIRIQPKISIWIRILFRIRIQVISYQYLNFFSLLHNYKIFSSKEVN